MKTVLLIHGPNLNLLGVREPEVYGTATLADVEAMVVREAAEAGIAIKAYQSNHEGALIDFIQAEYEQADGIIINPGALTHYGYSLRDCLAGITIPVVEVHISNLQKREQWRRTSVLSEVCAGVISGLGTAGYLSALRYFVDERGTV